MNKIRPFITNALFSGLIVLAGLVANAASPCWIAHYQPRVPASLQK